jgi:signal transduction histidine kinase
VLEVRRVLDALGPAALEGHHLSTAIHTAAGRLGFDSTAGPSFTYTSGGTTELPRRVEEAAYLIAGEALHNVARHAHATHCHVDLEGRGGVLEIHITDDGVGMAEVTPTALARVGINSMRRRAQALGGTFEFSPSSAGSGTVVHVRLPLEARR